MYERSTRLASRLRAAGVGPGDRVAYLGTNHPAFAETMFATHMLGGVFVPLNFRLTAPELDYVLGHSGSAVLVYGPSAGAADGPSRRTPRPSWPCANPPTTSTATSPGWPRAIRTVRRGSLPGRPGVHPLHLRHTGQAQGRPLTHANVIWNTLNLMVALDIASDEVTLMSAPLFHVAALNQTLLPTFLKGGCCVIMPSWDVGGATT